jgi:hypothetical protein
MDEKKFWQLTELIDRTAMEDGDGESAIAPLLLALSGLPIREIEGYEEALAKKLYLIDGEVFADNAGESGQSGDGFLYARCYVVAQGQATYDSVLADPTSMPAQLENWFEELLYVCSQAWAAKTGRDADEWDFETGLSYETGSNASAWPRISVVQDADPFDLRLDRAVTWAGHAFKSKQYETVVKVLERHEKQLSGKQWRMLQLSRSALLSTQSGNQSE